MSLEVRSVCKEYRAGRVLTGVEALAGVDLVVETGELVSVIGPSGCGKTTLLRIIAGLGRPSSGDVLLDGRPVVKPGPEIGLVFQELALLPWRTVAGNIGLGPELKRLARTEIEAQVEEYVRMVELQGFEDRFVGELSAGMRQRVAMARALISEPSVLLMDEPFGALDAQTRRAMQVFLLELWRKRRETILFVTHDIDEAVFLSERVIGLSARPGRVRAVFPVDLPYPREPTDEDFNRVRREIHRYLEEERTGRR